MKKSKSNERKRKDIYQRYREVLKMSDLTKNEIDEMRNHMILLARTICEHVWGEDFY